MSDLRLVFMGTPDFATEPLARLSRSHHVELVVTQPDRPRGRHLRLSPTPVKIRAAELGLRVRQPAKPADIREELAGISPDAVVVVAYGKILPKWLLDLPRYGCVNLHPSLLPKYRGAAPIQRAILAGEKEMGVTTILLGEGIDDGPILLQKQIPIQPGDNLGTLIPKLAQEGADLLLQTLDLLDKGQITPRPQDHGKATYADKLGKEEQAVDWTERAEAVINRIKAFAPSPGAHSRLKGLRLKILGAEIFLEEREPKGQPGEILETRQGGFVVATGTSSLLITEVQPEGKRRMDAGAFLRGHHIEPGEKLLAK